MPIGEMLQYQVYEIDKIRVLQETGILCRDMLFV